ncbi:hypothetical protein, partial [Nocardioides malaquae]|uniref:hypothetical protein n=1 Tax=Nocardioides malaquae TaxID=2773426 RepID=UPI001D0D5FFF
DNYLCIGLAQATPERQFAMVRYGSCHALFQGGKNKMHCLNYIHGQITEGMLTGLERSCTHVHEFSTPVDGKVGYGKISSHMA